MSIISQFCLLPVKSHTSPSQTQQFTTKSRLLSPTPLNSTLLSSGAKREISTITVKAAASSESFEWGSEKPTTSSNGGAAIAVADEETAVDVDENSRLKQQLVDSFYGTDRGLKASSDTRAEVVELITQLEAKNPTPSPTDALSLLNGKWILA